MVKLDCYKYTFDNINKDLEDLTQRLDRWKEKVHNQKVGYSPKCKVCNSPHLDKIEELKEEGYTLEEIKETLNLDLSIMSLSRHFKNHYPKNQSTNSSNKFYYLKTSKRLT